MEEFKIYRPPHLSGTEIWSVKDSDQKCCVFHDTYTVCSIRQGSLEWQYRGDSLFSGPKNLMLMEPGEVHITKIVFNRGTYSVLHLEPSLIEQFARESGIRKTVHLTKVALKAEDCFHLFDKFHRSLETSQEALTVESYLARGIHFLMERCSEFTAVQQGAVARKPLENVRAFLLENWREKVSLQELAGMAGLSRFHFLRSFSQHFGLPPHSYQRQIRITKACDLIKKGFPVKGLDHGFADQSHFIRHFKNIIGVTPGNYASMVRRPFSGASALPD